jgi:RNase adapter protein RapZ
VNGPLEVVIVSGVSGSGKSTAIRVFEDLGYYCIDNLPLVLLRRFLELCEQSRENISRVVLGVDVRERQIFRGDATVFDELRRAGYRLEILFFDASDEILVRRFNETRRPHPLAGDAGPAAGIAKEREQLAALRARADRVIDTTGMTVHDLRASLWSAYREPSEGDVLAVTIMSFGYKFGIPTDADMILDARFLANPYFVEGLRDRSGLDREVANFVLDRAETESFLQRVGDLLDFTLPLFRREGKSYLTVGVGCTGGRHRSVALAESLARRLEGKCERVRVRHRDMER